MRFDRVFPRSFNVSSVRQFAPTSSGVYALTNAVEWLYIGETDNIQESLLQHLRQADPALLNQHPTGFVYEICDRAKRSGRQDSLIQEYGPACNPHRSR